MTSSSSGSGVRVDQDARALRDPVTVVVSPGGAEFDADNWSDANNLLSAGYRVKEGHPTGPGEDAPTAGTPVADSTEDSSS